MFDWFWHILYQVSKTLFKIIDGLIQCANYLCGVAPVRVAGDEVDFLEYILTSNQIGFAFRVAALIGMIIVVVFSIIAILRTLSKEKAEGTPAQIAGKAVKSVLSFLFIPLIMIVVVNAGNVFMEAMYKATLQGQASLGDFLFKAFAMESGVAESEVDAFLANPNLDWRNTWDVWELMDLSEFEFIFSWIAGGVILGSIGMSMMYFVSRIISIAILYIAAPFSIGSSVLDDGARFKLWREQILVKFITGYGMMIAINIFAMICLLVMNPSLVFFEKGSFIDYLMKLLLIAGGGVSLKQAMALIGNLISNGAGSNELRDSAIAGGLSGLAKGIAGRTLTGKFLGAVGRTMGQEIVGSAAQKILPSWAQRSYGGGGSRKGGKEDKDEKGTDSKNSNTPNTASDKKDVAKTAITGTGNGSKDKPKTEDNTNDKKVGGTGKGEQMVNQAIEDTDKKQSEDKQDQPGGYDDIYD